MFQDEDGPLPRRERLHGLPQPIADLTGERAALGGRIRVRDLARAHLLVLVGRRLVEVEDETAALQPVLAAVDADPRQPRLERRALAEVLQVLVGPQEALLRRAVRLARVAEEPIGDP